MNRRSTHVLILSYVTILVAVQHAVLADPPQVQNEVSTSQHEPVAAKADAARLVWHESLASGLTDAQRHRRLIVVKAGAVWCGWCRRLDAELSDAKLVAELEKWTCVQIDIDKARSDARKLGVGPVPALRVLRPDGRVAASQDGFLPAANLTEWLAAERKRIDLSLDDELTRKGPPTDEALAALIQAFGSQEAATREAAVRRIIPHVCAAQAVVSAFVGGGLATRLTALEVLSEWKAPIDALDPWNPETITSERGEALAQWAATFKEAPPPDARLAHPTALLAELDAYVRADSDGAAAAIAERLARHRGAPLPHVYERLKESPTDQTRERLTRLRYRLAASDDRALRWPDGLARLASNDAAIRRAAVNELAAGVTEADVPLLTELFGDSEPIVREISLKAMKKIGGATANESLARLLDDPDANVRAAVLKELAAQPSEPLVAKVIAYTDRETDADLIVHAIHVLSASKSRDAVNCLFKLKSHAQWQVRAEAAEAIGHAIQQNSGLSATTRDAAIAALVEVLDDSDSFVVSRAFGALSGTTDPQDRSRPKLTAAQIEGLIDKHPELATDAVMMVVGGKDAFESIAEMRDQFGDLDYGFGGNDNDIDPSAVPTLRHLSTHKLPAVRALSISMLADVAPKRSSRALRTTIADPDATVRIAAAAALRRVMQSYKPKPRSAYEQINSYEEQAMPTSGGGGLLGAIFGSRPSRRTAPKPPKPATTQPTLPWPESFKAGQGRPKWMADMNEPLRAMLNSASAEERAVAAAPAIALGNETDVMTVLIDTIKSDGAQTQVAAESLPWLAKPNRGALLEALLSVKLTPEAIEAIALRLGSIRDDGAETDLWRLLESAEVTADSAGVIFRGMSNAYHGHSMAMYVDESEQPEVKQRIVSDTTSRIASGSEAQRLVALSLLAGAAPESALPLARELFEAPNTPDSLRRDCFQIALLCQEKSLALQSALKSLDHADPKIRQIAIQCVAQEGGIHNWLREGHIYINTRINSYSDYSFVSGRQRGKPIRVEPIPDVDPATIRPFLQDPEPEIRAYAAYILATLKDGSRIGEIARVWRSKGKYDQVWTRMLWRAISAADADEETPVLEEIYKAIGKTDYRIGEFYWTVRSMTGSKAKAFRKRVYKEVGKYQLE